MVKFTSITIKDIAKELGLSTSTVSRALRDSHEISHDTKKMVMEYAEKINFKPNRIAQSLKDHKSMSIGVIVTEIANSFFSQVINGVESIAHNNGYTVIIAQSMESAERELLSLQHLTSSSIDGLIISVSTESKNFHYLKELHEKGMPIVFVDRAIDHIETHKVIVDNFKGAYKATKHLINKGKKNIAILSNDIGLSISRDRMAGYETALTDHNLPIKESLIKYCSLGGMKYAEVEEAMKELMRRRIKPDAIFAGSDKLTIGCLRFLKERKIKVPDDVAVIGFSNTDLTDLIDPPLSVIRQPAFEMGEASTELLLSLIKSKKPVTKFETRIHTTELFVKKST
jgi:LacI family transcriptional regulator